MQRADGVMRATRTKRRCAVIGAGVLVGALAACASPAPSVSSDEALDTYASVLDDIESALVEEYPTVAWASDGDTSVQRSDDDDPCTVFFPTIETRTSLWAAAGGDWDEIAAVIDPVLADYGFPGITADEDVAGGWLVYRAQDDDGAMLRIDDKDSSSISLSIDVTDADCPTP